MVDVGVGLIGSGFMGRSHALAFKAAAEVFAGQQRPRLELLADVDEPAAQRAASTLGFRRATGDWRALVADAAVDLVDISTPTLLHKPMALAAIAAGKAVYCEKPLAATAPDAREMAQAAEAAGVSTFVGFNYLRNPLIALARTMVAGGEIGEVVGFRGIHAEDFFSDPETPWTWRLDAAGGCGAVADLGSHILSLADYLLGDIAEVCGQTATVVAERPISRGSSERRGVTVDDQARALLRFASGATGSIEASWVATGRKMMLAFEITGTRGSIVFDQERLNELRLYEPGQRPGRAGFKTILAGPEHPPYGAFCPAPGHQLGYNDLKTIEVHDILAALAGGQRFHPDFRDAARIQAVVDAIAQSARARSWLSVPLP